MSYLIKDTTREQIISLSVNFFIVTVILSIIVCTNNLSFLLIITVIPVYI